MRVGWDGGSSARVGSLVGWLRPPRAVLILPLLGRYCLIAAFGGTRYLCPHHPSTIGPGLLSPKTTKPVILIPKLFKTGQITPQGIFGGKFCFFFFLFIITESLKNHNKSQKNPKIENLILLDSTWVDLHSEYIIWYALVQIFCSRFRSILFCN